MLMPNNGVLGDELKWVYFARGEDYQLYGNPNTLYNVDPNCNLRWSNLEM